MKLLNWIVLLAVCLAPVSAAARGSEGQAKRNIVLLVSDDHSPDMGAYGNPVIQTPHLDALARDGVRFTNAFATTASCSASRSVLLTGLQNHRTAQYGHAHDFHHFESWANIRSLPALLREAGYRTGRVGKFHVAPAAAYAFEYRFDSPERDDVAMAEAAREFIYDTDDDRPFLLMMATHDPHRGERFNQDRVRVGLEDIDTLDDFGRRPWEPILEGERLYDPAEVIVPSFLPDTPVVRAELANYYRAVTRMDAGYGRLIQMLKDSGNYDNTLIIYLSDHGIAFPGAKTTTYDPGLRIPLLIRSPDQSQRGIANNALVSMVDITPTILDFAGVTPPRYDLQLSLAPVARLMDKDHGLHGRSILPILGQENPAGWDEIFASHTFHELQMYYPMRVVRDRQYKLIWNIASGLTYPFAADLWESPSWQHVYREGPDALWGKRTVRAYMQRPEFELYDIAADPDETVNLAEDPAYAEVLERYKKRIYDRQRTTQDPWLLKWLYE